LLRCAVGDLELAIWGWRSGGFGRGGASGGCDELVIGDMALAQWVI